MCMGLHVLVSPNSNFNNCMNGSKSEWANHKQITSQVISDIIPTNVGHILWRVYLEMLGTYSVRGIPGYTC